MANLFKIKGKKPTAGKTSPSAEGMGTHKGLSARAPAPDARKQTTTHAPGSAAGSLLAMDSRNLRNQSGNPHGIMSTSDKGSLSPRNYPDLSGVPVSQGGTQTAAKLKEQQGTVDPAANAARRGKLPPGQKRASMASSRPDTPLASLLNLNSPKGAAENADANNRKRGYRTKANAPTTMLQGGLKLG